MMTSQVQTAGWASSASASANGASWPPDEDHTIVIDLSGQRQNITSTPTMAPVCPPPSAFSTASSSSAQSSPTSSSVVPPPPRRVSRGSPLINGGATATPDWANGTLPKTAMQPRSQPSDDDVTGGRPSRPRQLPVADAASARKAPVESPSVLNFTPQRHELQHNDSPSEAMSPLPPSLSTSTSQLAGAISTGYYSYTLRSSRYRQRSLERRCFSSQNRLSAAERKSRSHDFLDRVDTTGLHAAAVATPSSEARLVTAASASARPKMNRIEKHLYLGSLEAATDVILLASHGITHIVTIDSVPLPRKMASLLPRVENVHLQVTDLPDEDLLAHVATVKTFVDEAVAAGGNVLVHCFRGRSRSAALVIAYLMQKHACSMEKAYRRVLSKRDCINPHDGFMAQLKLYEIMNYGLDTSNLQYRMFRLSLAGDRMRKARILTRSSLEGVLDSDPGSFSSSASSSAASKCPQVFKCKRCRRTLATAHGLLPHYPGERPSWSDARWRGLRTTHVAEASHAMGLCAQSVFVAPVAWMADDVRHCLDGRLHCPGCQARVGDFSWVRGHACSGCGAAPIAPAFQLDVTEIIFKTKSRFLRQDDSTDHGHGGGGGGGAHHSRQPVEV